jgi:hypothetical protein
MVFYLGIWVVGIRSPHHYPAGYEILWRALDMDRLFEKS